MIAYIETSAILAVVCDEPDGPAVQAVLDLVTVGLTSRLTLIECARVMHRQQARLPDAARLRTALGALKVLALTDEVLLRAEEPFPVEQLRTLDALHIATAVLAAEEVPDLAIVALDRRVRQNAHTLDLSVLPRDSELTSPQR